MTEAEAAKQEMLSEEFHNPKIPKKIQEKSAQLRTHRMARMGHGKLEKTAQDELKDMLQKHDEKVRETGKGDILADPDHGFLVDVGDEVIKFKVKPGKTTIQTSVVTSEE